MNIFYLDACPKLAAQYHCDQHLNSAILESAQMLSTVVHQLGGGKESLVYLPTHVNHPCVQMLRHSTDACIWVYRLCHGLSYIRRQVVTTRPHESMSVIEAAMDIITEASNSGRMPFVPYFCGPGLIQERDAEFPTVPLKYQELYRQKRAKWAGTAYAMSYRGRTAPDFLQSIASA